MENHRFKSKNTIKFRSVYYRIIDTLSEYKLPRLSCFQTGSNNLTPFAGSESRLQETARDCNHPVQEFFEWADQDLKQQRTFLHPMHQAQWQ